MFRGPVRRGGNAGSGGDGRGAGGARVERGEARRGSGGMLFRVSDLLLVLFNIYFIKQNSRSQMHLNFVISKPATADGVKRPGTKNGKKMYRAETSLCIQ